MNKIKTLFLSIAIVVLSSLCVWADGDNATYDLNEIGITVTVPESNGLVTYTRTSDIAENDSLVADGSALLGDMLDKSEYLRAIHANTEYYVSVISKQTSLSDFSDLSEENVINVTRGGLDGFLSRKEINSDIFVAKPRNIQFSLFDFYEEYSNGTKTNGYAYVTVTNGRMYCFVLTMANGRELTDTHRTIVREMATSCVFVDGGTEEETVIQVVEHISVEEQTDTNSTSASDMMTKIVNIAKYIILIVVLVAVVIVIHGFFTSRKVEKEKPVQIGYTVKRTPQYENRLKRVMDSVPDPVVPEQPPMPKKDDLEPSDEDMLDL